MTYQRDCEYDKYWGRASERKERRWVEYMTLVYIFDVDRREALHGGVLQVLISKIFFIYHVYSIIFSATLILAYAYSSQ